MRVVDAQECVAGQKGRTDLTLSLFRERLLVIDGENMASQLRMWQELCVTELR